MINSLKKYFYISLGLHFIIFLILAVISNNGNIKQPFIVFGAHSKKDYHTMIPFLSHKKLRVGNSTKSAQIGKGASKKQHQEKSAKNGQINKSSKKSVKKTAQRPIKSKVKSKIDTDEVEFQKWLKKTEIDTQKEIDLKEKKDKAKKKKLEEKLKQEKQKEALEKAERARLEKEIQEQEATKEDSAEAQIPEKKDDQSQSSGDTNTDEQASEEQLSNGEQTAIPEEFIFTLSGNVDAELTEYQKHVQQEVSRIWKPPLGVPKGTTCKIKFTISKDGKVADFKIVKKSDVLIYDLSILRIAHLFKFHKSLWGRGFEVDFLQ